MVQSQFATLNIETRSGRIPCRRLARSSARLLPHLQLCRLRLAGAHFFSKHPNGYSRNFDTEQPFPYCYGLRSDQSLEGVANLKTVADPKVRPGS